MTYEGCYHCMTTNNWALRQFPARTRALKKAQAPETVCKRLARPNYLGLHFVQADKF